MRALPRLRRLLPDCCQKCLPGGQTGAILCRDMPNQLEGKSPLGLGFGGEIRPAAKSGSSGSSPFLSTKILEGKPKLAATVASFSGNSGALTPAAVAWSNHP